MNKTVKELTLILMYLTSLYDRKMAKEQMSEVHGRVIFCCVKLIK